ncbi:TlpA family protein disulfide reductase [Fibrella aquatilis]|uniref:TlpA family protein disulfide reductase n=1 Tax=Fibrella aquatilis TaxID=2817059 RepID=A0A939G9D3_9BACT|nr:TlpA disulfide reductase family protein [Fibrella aquatilis]MBO0934654.1 TlpA family protein disulfide reductase [Fibrella aquatilis]
MASKWLIFLICWLQIVSVVAQERPDFLIKPHSKAALRIDYKYNNQPRKLFAATACVFPYNDYLRLDDSLQVGSGSKIITYNVSSPQRGLFLIDGQGGLIYLIPNDTLTIQIDLSKSNPLISYKFIGKYASINQYYFDQAKALNGIPSFMNALIANNAPSITKYKQQKDSLLKVEYNYFYGYVKEHKLPVWFLREEERLIRYTDAALKVNTVNYREFIKMDKPNSEPTNYYDFITPDLLNNSQAAHIEEYQRFLRDYFYRLYFRQKAVSNPVDLFPTLAANKLSGLAWEVFMARLIDELMASMPTHGEKLLKSSLSKFVNKKWLIDLDSFYKDAYTLKPGQLAPNFALENKLDSLAYLNDFRGQIIYLSFWFTGCAPCRQEMPLENDLVNYFDGKPVKIISICVNSSRSDWAKVSKLYNLQTVNLYANDSWAKTLISKYNIKAYPHYVLIDRAGKVVRNNCEKPSRNAKLAIEALLKD